MGGILIQAPNWIGDCVMSLPALREIRRLNPGERLTLLVRPWVAGLYQEQELVDEILIGTREGSAWSDFLRLKRRIRGFHRAVLFPNSFRSALLVWAARIPERIGYAREGRQILLTRWARPRHRQRRPHQVYYYLDLLHQTGLSPLDYLEEPSFRPDIRLRAPDQGIREAGRLLREEGLAQPLVLINPGAQYGAAKRWFPERYAALAVRLHRECRAQVALVGSANELPLAQQIRRLGAPAALLTGRTSLQGLLGLLAAARLLITNDSGPMHLAAALGTPQIALFGSTDETATGPLSPEAAIIHKHVECSPCLLRECPIDLRCFDRIQVDEVFELAKSRLHETPPRCLSGPGRHPV